MENKIIENLEELEDNWKSCYIKGLRKGLTKKKLVEGFKLGCTIWRKI